MHRPGWPIDTPLAIPSRTHGEHGRDAVPVLIGQPSNATGPHQLLLSPNTSFCKLLQASTSFLPQLYSTHVHRHVPVDYRPAPAM